MNTYKSEFDENLNVCLSDYRSRFPNVSDVVAVCAPGRVNLIGEHVDYNDGFVFPMAIGLYTIVVGAFSDDNMCRIKSMQHDLDTNDYVEFDINNLEPSKERYRWANYIKGVIAKFHGTKRPFNAVIKSNVPLGAGLSSSASLEVATYTFLENLTQEFTNDVDKALRCQKAEHDYAFTPCGIMDQFISTMRTVLSRLLQQWPTKCDHELSNGLVRLSFTVHANLSNNFKGKNNHALLIDCRSLESKLYPLTDPNIEILVTNSNVKHELGESEYASRRNNCIQAAKLLNKPSLRDVTLDELDENKHLFDSDTYRRARHAVTEIDRTKQAAQALTNNDMVLFGKLMNESHESLKNDFNVSCNELDSLVDIALSCDGCYGSRMTGAGFGGCTVSLINKANVDEVIEKIKELECVFSFNQIFHSLPIIPECPAFSEIPHNFKKSTEK